MIELTPEEMADLTNLLNEVRGMEAARRFLPIYDKVQAAMKAVEASARAAK